MGKEYLKEVDNKSVMVIEEEVEVSEDGGAGEEVDGSKEEQAGTKRLKLEQKKEDERSIVISGGSVDLSSTALTTTGGDDETSSTALITTNGTNDFSDEQAIDTRSPYRYGSPLLPALPVRTSRQQVPKALSASSSHISEFRRILKDNHVTTQDVEVTHRFNTGTPLSRTTLTLLISSTASSLSTWTPAITALRSYINSQSPPLTLGVEIIDARITNGIYTLPILTTDTLIPFIAKKKHGLVELLNECGAEWSSLEFWYRGLGNKREECKPTVLVGVLEPNRKVWRDVMEKLKEKIGAKMEVEISFRMLGKVQ